MDDKTLFTLTLERLGLSNVAAAAILNTSKVTVSHYSTGKHKVNPAVWRSLLEYEAKIDQREGDIMKAAVRMGAPAAETPKRRGRPRHAL